MKLAIAVMLAATSIARADSGEDENFLVGPVLGIGFSRASGATPLFGIEGGGGIAAERANVGLEYRTNTLIAYVELDPWFVVGGSLGVAFERNNDVHPVIGLWEGYPLAVSAPCGNRKWAFLATFSAGIRYTGSWEVYVAPKVGSGRLECLDRT